MTDPLDALISSVQKGTPEARPEVKAPSGCILLAHLVLVTEHMLSSATVWHSKKGKKVLKDEIETRKCLYALSDGERSTAVVLAALEQNIGIGPGKIYAYDWVDGQNKIVWRCTFSEPFTKGNATDEKSNLDRRLDPSHPVEW